jgi:hypothetical protein
MNLKQRVAMTTLLEKEIDLASIEFFYVRAIALVVPQRLQMPSV